MVSIGTRPARTGDPARPALMGYQPALDGLRAIAVAAVLLYHFEIDWIPGGFLGVDVFFVVSGYLITSLMLQEHRTDGGLSLRQFWLRRARRLLPALYAMLALTSVWVALFVPDAIDQLRTDVVAALLYVTNWWYVVDGQSYFEALGRPPVLQHLWSLAVEEQWYLVWPLVFGFALRRVGGEARRLVVPVFAACLASTAWMWFLFDGDAEPSRLYYGTDTRLAGLLLGAGVALVWSPWRWRGAGRHRLPAIDLGAAAALGLLLVLMLAWGEDTTRLYQGGFLLVAVLSVTVIAAAVHPGASGVRTLLSLPPLVWIGTRSYGLYLWHWPVVTIFRQRDLGWSYPATLVFWVVLTFALTEASFRFVETPIRHGALGRLRARWRTLDGFEAARLRSRLMAVGAVSLVVVAGVALRFTTADKVDIAQGGEEQTLELTTTTPTTLAAAASGGGAAAALPVVTTAPATTLPADLPYSVAVVGDSQANALVKNAPNGLGTYLTLVNGAVEGCGLVDDGDIVTAARFRRTFDNCDGWQQDWAASAAGSDIALVVLGAWDVFDIARDAGVLAFGSPDHDAMLRAQLASGIDALTATGAHVALLEVPCYRNVDGGGLVALPERSQDTRTAHLNDLLREAAAADPDHVSFVPGPAEWCTDEAVATDLGARWDGVHYYRPGAKLVFDTITATLLQLPV